MRARLPTLALLLSTACAATGPAPGGGGPRAVEGTEYDEIVVSATRTPRATATVPRFTSTVPADAVVSRQARTTPEALQEEPGVYVQETNLGGGSPFIRGLTGNQILLLVDGIRINNSAFSRFGPNQYLNTVDPFSLDSIEVVRGPNSVHYGSDAIGGVVALATRGREPGARDEALAHEIETFLRYGSAAREKTAAVRGAGGADGWSAAGGFLFQEFEDLRGGRDSGVQAPSGYAVFGGDVKVSRRLAEGQTLTVAYQLHEADDVPRTDRVVSGRNLVFTFDPQRRQLAYLRWSGTFDGVVDGAQATVSWHRQEEGRTEVRASDPGTTRRLDDRVDTLGAQAQAHRRLGDHRVSAGFEVYDDDVSSRRVDTTIGQPPAERAGRFPDGASYTSLGLWLQDEWEPDDRWTVIAGLRWSRFDWDAVVQDPVGPIAGDASELTGQVGATFEAAPGLLPFAGISTGFRAPNLDDLTIFDVFGGGIEVPNPDLDPESSIQYELGVKVRREHVRVTAAAYYQDLSDLIQRTPTGNVVDGETEFTRRNVGDARIYGFELGASVRIPDTPWTVSGNLAWARGDDESNGVPLRRIPPLFGRLGLRYDDAGGRWYAEAFSRFADDQDRLSPGDVSDPRIPAGGTPGWATFNLRGGVDLNESISIEAALENLFDTTYRIHGSGLDAPGTNFLLTLIGRF